MPRIGFPFRPLSICVFFSPNKATSRLSNFIRQSEKSRRGIRQSVLPIALLCMCVTLPAIGQSTIFSSTSKPNSNDSNDNSDSSMRDGECCSLVTFIPAADRDAHADQQAAESDSDYNEDESDVDDEEEAASDAVDEDDVDP